MGGEKEGQVGEALRERPAGGGLYGSGGERPEMGFLGGCMG